jgi:hypothetical protein
MNRQKVGITLFWVGVFLFGIWTALTVIQSPVHRVQTAEALEGTIHEIWGLLFTLRIIGGGGFTFAIVGVLLYTTEKGSYFWLLGFLPFFLNFGQYWQPSTHVPALFGIGGTVIAISYFGILWSWTRCCAAHQATARIGMQIQLLGYSVLIAVSLFLCMHFGNPKQLALADLAIPSGEFINLSLAFGMLLFFLGHYVAARGSKGANPGS